VRPGATRLFANPIVRGSFLASAAAVLFGLTTPLVKHFGEGVGAFTTAALLYAGAAVGAGLRRASADEPRVALRHAPRIAMVAVFGAVIAPVAFAWGLQRSGAVAASLLLNLEAAFTVLLARFFYREPLGQRVLLAVFLMIAGGGLLPLRLDAGGGWSVFGVAAVSLATLGWALDNTLTRPLSDLDPRAVVFWKATTGAVLSTVVVLVVGDAWPTGSALLGLLACGAAGYGLSLQLYLRAQRILGAARTGSLFALAPFVGTALSFALGDRSEVALILAASALFATAVYLHATEVHRHRHVHEPIEHEHAHTHDDGHHSHTHDPPVSGSHTHSHRHERVEHEHPHGSDLHHRHGHD
jgi:drug/metabolite transporter (DMT)-like permease